MEEITYPYLMARQSNHQKLEGTIGNITYLKLDGKYIARKKSSLDAERIANDPAFENSRGASTEFGRISTLSAFFKNTLDDFITGARDSKLHRRVNSLLHAVKRCDPAENGSRTVQGGLSDTVCDELFGGFEFNVFAPVNRFNFRPAKVDMNNGIVDLFSFIPANVKAPKGATHLILSCCFAQLDFNNKTGGLYEPEEIVADLSDKQRRNVRFTPKVFDDRRLLLCLMKFKFIMVSNDIEYKLAGKESGGAVIAGVRFGF